MSVSVANFLFEAVNFLALAALLGWVAFKPMREALTAEQQKHEAKLHEAEQAQADAKRMREAAQQERAQLEEELRERRAELLKEAEQEAEQAKHENQKREQQDAEAFQARLDNARKGQIDALTEDAARIAAQSVRGLLTAIDGPELELALVSATCEELRKAQLLETGAVTVEFARPLSPESREKLTTVLPQGFNEREQPSLGAGLRVLSGAGKVEASALLFAQQAADEVRRHLSAPPAAQESSDAPSSAS